MFYSYESLSVYIRDLYAVLTQVRRWLQCLQTWNIYRWRISSDLQLVLTLLQLLAEDSEAVLVVQSSD
jgi:hypothetical protein